MDHRVADKLQHCSVLQLPNRCQLSISRLQKAVKYPYEWSAALLNTCSAMCLYNFALTLNRPALPAALHCPADFDAYLAEWADKVCTTATHMYPQRSIQQHLV
jgi:hypothetical protein